MRQSKCNEMDLKSFKSGSTKQQRNLLKAVESGTLAEVKKLFPQFRNLERDEEFFNYILLVTALDRGHKSISKFLIKKDCKTRISTKTKSHCTPLYYAVKLKDEDICKELCKRGASIHDVDANEESALELAMLERNFKLIYYFFKHHFKQPIVRLNPNSEKDVALFHAACWHGAWDIAEVFMKEHKFSPCTRSGFKSKEWKDFTPLHFALKGRTSWSIIRALWQHDDINVFAEDEKGRTPLHLAFRSKNDTFINMYIGDIALDEVSNPVDENELSHFHIMCSTELYAGTKSLSNHLQHLKNFIDNIEDIDSAVSLQDKNYPGYTALHFAARRSCSKILKLLLENGADSSKCDKKGRTPLHVAIESSCSRLTHKGFEAVEFLIEHEANVDAGDIESCTPLHRAFYARRNNERLFQLLLPKSRMDKNLTDSHGLSYFHIACSGNDLDKVKSLLKNGASVNACVKLEAGSISMLNYDDYCGYSALHFAIRFNQVKVVEFLLSHGADVNVNIGKGTPLHMVCSNNLTQLKFTHLSMAPFFDWTSNRNDRIHVMKLLLEKNASVDAKDSHGNTPLLCACSIPWDLTLRVKPSYFLHEKSQTYNNDLILLKEISVRRKTIVDILLDHGADINARNSYGECILHLIAENYGVCPSGFDLAISVLEKGAELDVANNRGITPFHVAVEKSMSNKLDLSLIELFLECGPNVNAKCKKFNTPLHVAAEQYDSGETCQEIFRTLLHCDEIDVNIQNSSGDTPLHIAVRRRKTFCIGGLLDYGSNINLKNSEGYTPLHIAHKWLSKDSYEDMNTEKYIQFYLTKHVKLWITAKRFVSDEVRAVYESLMEHFPESNARLDSRLDEEVKKLKLNKIDQYNSLFDILAKDADDMAKHVKNKQLKKVISSSTFDTDFPLFNGMLENRFEQGKVRSAYLKPAIKALKFFTDVNWPDSCVAHIMKYLSNGNLEPLILASKDANSRKRLRQDSSCSGESQVKLHRSE